MSKKKVFFLKNFKFYKYIDVIIVKLRPYEVKTREIISIESK